MTLPSVSASPEARLPVFSHQEKIAIVAGLMLGMFLAALEQTIVTTALPGIAGELRTAEHMSWVVSAYLLTSTAATPIYGKLSDLYGRKLMLQIAIGIFLVTSLLCGLAQTMTELIVYRALQGLGGGGLLAMAHATIADVVSPRERGRYQGYIAAVFATASVAGPVLGGLFAAHLGWQWIFWINLPFGLAALVVAERTLKRLHVKRLRHSIDYAGAALIVSAVCCILLITTMGGNDVAWDSPIIAGLAVASVVLFGLSVWQERRAPEPILPPRLFRNRNYVIAMSSSLLLAMIMIGGLVFMPLFLQMVYRLPADQAGLLMIPLTLTAVLGAITAGQLVTRTGRYKHFPLIGLTLQIVAMLLLGTVDAATPHWQSAIYMGLSGYGIGLFMPVILISVQNTVEPRDLGVGTASVSFFRSMGGSFGVALFSAVLVAMLDRLIAALPGAAALGPQPAVQLLRAGPAALDSAPPALRAGVLLAMTDAFQIVFWLAAAIAAAALAIIVFLREIPLSTSSGMSSQSQAASQSPAERAVATVEKTSPGTSVGAPAD
jgi:EmrB/QacA subfamily drug resistance transporter